MRDFRRLSARWICRRAPPPKKIDQIQVLKTKPPTEPRFPRAAVVAPPAAILQAIARAARGTPGPPARPGPQPGPVRTDHQDPRRPAAKLEHRGYQLLRHCRSRRCLAGLDQLPLPHHGRPAGRLHQSLGHDLRRSPLPDPPSGGSGLTAVSSVSTLTVEASAAQAQVRRGQPIGPGLPANGPVSLFVRPERIRLTSAATGPHSMRVRIGDGRLRGRRHQSSWRGRTGRRGAVMATALNDIQSAEPSGG